MNITGAIFDFDGTVFDSMHIWKGVKFQFFDRIGLVLSEEQREEFKEIWRNISFEYFEPSSD